MQLLDFTAKWADGSRHKTDANIAYQVTKELEDRGMLTAQNLVDVSRPEDAPLHQEFEWNDTIAAEEHRKYQARNIIRSIQIVREDNPQPEKVYAHVRIEHPEYTTVVKALTIPGERELYLKSARRDMETFIARYHRLTELDAVLNAMNNVLELYNDEQQFYRDTERKHG